MTFLLIPHLRVQAANIQNASFLLGGPPVLPAYLFAHALGRKVNFQAPKVALIHHYIQPKGQVDTYGIFYPQQRRAASLTFSAQVGSDYDKKSMRKPKRPVLSLQPVATADMCVSLIIETHGLRSLQGVETLLFGGRFSGGTIISTGKCRTSLSFEEALGDVTSGYVVLDRKDLLEKREGKNQAQLFIETLGTLPKSDSDTTWLSATNLGYAAISSFENRVGVREGYKHAFAEPLVGIVQYRSVRDCGQLQPEQMLWQSEWIGEDIFRVVQKKIDKGEGE
jgi:CRISPR-associated protein Csy2